ncbi:protein kinase domain-containing protein [Cryptosporidium muris RN66]|uniref:Protein kinase domain-containing protein n=1 Tax=Cryptosporidium muris (strain RN66) TaxID=441375 RepID=B6A9V4_CRYMR|nr:protein kinase domain-containing protein [Cryptosporidium muris RN66]EEA04995.1 protein kinase domain-containing protein [Cryptosporidium muris RN66]|eukprot:XP_002139344.1 protein kinase domain-containing protein [Cryptosporidium muris RN66]
MTEILRKEVNSHDNLCHKSNLVFNINGYYKKSDIYKVDDTLNYNRDDGEEDSHETMSSLQFSPLSATTQSPPQHAMGIFNCTSLKEAKKTLTYATESVIGHGSFGIVYRARVLETGDYVAIKKVYQDKRYKHRELQIMRILDCHPSIVELYQAFYTVGEKQDDVYLNIVMECLGGSMYQLLKQCNNVSYKDSFPSCGNGLPIILVKLYSYQIFRALAYMSTLNVCHRDIKPQNLLLNPSSGILKVCDFGSAKRLLSNDMNVSYICSRFYRAPELIFGSTSYTTAVDIWSAGCVVYELMTGKPLFSGESGVDQLVEIIKLLGTPNKEQVSDMNPAYTKFEFPSIVPTPWSLILPEGVNGTDKMHIIDFLSRILVYSPQKRLKPLEALAHPFFDELRTSGPNIIVPVISLNNKKNKYQSDYKNTHTLNINFLFNFTQKEKDLYNTDIIERISPEWYKMDYK